MSNGQCSHGMCLNHVSDWETVGKHLLPNPGIFGKTYWFVRCCGESMVRLKDVKTVICKVCERREHVVTGIFAQCACCGGIRVISSR